MKTGFYFQLQNQTWHSPCSVCTSCTKPAFHWEFYIHAPLYCVHRTWTADWEETLHRSSDISSSFSVQIRLKIELCTSAALQPAPAFWAVSLLVLLLWLNAFGCLPASIQPPHPSHEGTKASGSEWRCWSCYKQCKRGRYLPLTSTNASFCCWHALLTPASERQYGLFTERMVKWTTSTERKPVLETGVGITS